MRTRRSHDLAPGRYAGLRARRAVAAAVLATLVVAPAGCGADGADGTGGTDPADAQSEDAFWAAMRIDAVEIDRTDSLAALVEQSDVVVRGRIRSFTFNRTVGDTAEEALSYALVTVTADEVLRGEVTAPTLPVELVLPVPAGTEPADHAAALAPEAPEEQLVLFLRRKRGPGDNGAYRPVNAGGVWASAGPARIDTPLSVEPPEERFGPEVSAMRSLDTLVAEVRAAPGRTPGSGG